MPRTAVIPIFSEESLAINASVVSDPIYLGKCGPNSTFYGDFIASLPGRTSVRYTIANSPTDNFHAPSLASPLCCASFLGGGGGGVNASRDRFLLSIMSSNWIQFKAKEQNASHTIFSMNLIVRQD